MRAPIAPRPTTSALDFEGLIEFNKYTLALAAGGFAYSLEKLVPAPTPVGRCLVLGLLALFLVSILCGVMLFAIATKAKHPRNPATAKSGMESNIARFGTAHAVTLTVALLLLGGMLVPRILATPSASPTCPCVGK